MITIFFGGAGLVVVNHCSPMLVEGLAVSAGFAAMVVSIISLSNGIGRFLWGMIFDKIGLKKCLLLIAFSFTLASAGMFFSFSSNITILFIVSSCLLLFSYGGNAITCPTVIRELFGHRTFSLNYSVLATDAIFTSFFPSIAGMVQVSTNGYQTPLMLLLIVSIISVLTVLVFMKLYHNHYE